MDTERVGHGDKGLNISQRGYGEGLAILRGHGPLLLNETILKNITLRHRVSNFYPAEWIKHDPVHSVLSMNIDEGYILFL
jgi:hypothetical protein